MGLVDKIFVGKYDWRKKNKGIGTKAGLSRDKSGLIRKKTAIPSVICRVNLEAKH